MIWTKIRARFAGAAAAASTGLLLAAASGCAERPASTEEPVYVETGDLDEIRGRGSLRILLPPRDLQGLPRRAYYLDDERALVERLAEELRLEPVFVTISDRAGMIEELLAGRGDLVVARLTVTDARRRRLAFSTPLEYVRERLVRRRDDPSIQQPADLAGKRVAVRASSSYHESLSSLNDEIGGIEIVTVPEYLDTEEILHLVARGEYDATLADEDIFRHTAGYVENLASPFAVTDDRPIAWAMRPGSTELKHAVDRFLHKQALTHDLASAHVDDLEAIRRRGVLRVLTLNSAVSYFLYRGQQMGFDYELTRRFADELGCRVQIVVPPRAELLIPWLLGGRGDLVSASMTVTEKRSREVGFTRPYHFVSEVVVARSDDPLQSPEQLRGRRIAVQPSSSYYGTVLALQPELGFEIVDASERLVPENLVAMVASGEHDLTVVDSHILDIELTYRDDVRAAFSLGEPVALAWMVRPRNGGLLEAADDFLEREYRGTFYNVIKDRYFENRKILAEMAQARPSRQGSISPYDEVFRKYGRQIEVDWRLLAAQAYEESRFDPSAESWAGAVGLMQVLPRTAEELGIDGDLRDPETGIRAGAMYLRWLIDRYEPSLPRGERLRFALAAYNAGRGHVLDGRRLAQEHGLDPDRWFGHVERVMPLLATPEHAATARFGYCRCGQPVAYVRGINERYQAYIRALDRAAHVKTSSARGMRNGEPGGGG